MSRAEADSILDDLARHAGLFDLSGQLGHDLADVAESDVSETFDRESTPAGDRWPELTSDYARWKQSAYPGRPMGVLTGELRANLIGVPELTESCVTVPIGGTEGAAAKARWMEDGSDNREARRFIGLSDAGIERSDDACKRHLQEGLGS